MRGMVIANRGVENRARRGFDVGDLRAMTAGRPIDIEVDGGVAPDVAGQLAAAGANAFVAGSAVFKGGTMQSYKANISAIRNAAAAARGEMI